MNLPIYRANRIDSDEYAIGCLNIWVQNGKTYHSIIEIGKYPSPFDNIHIVDPSTIAIHFHDMLDSQGNKIFASLNKDGKGGDILKCYLGSNIENCTFREMTFKYQSFFRFTIGAYDIDAYPVICKVGIQE